MLENQSLFEDLLISENFDLTCIQEPKYNMNVRKRSINLRNRYNALEKFESNWPTRNQGNPIQQRPFLKQIVSSTSRNTDDCIASCSTVISSSAYKRDRSTVASDESAANMTVGTSFLINPGDTWPYTSNTPAGQTLNCAQMFEQHHLISSHPPEESVHSDQQIDWCVHRLPHGFTIVNFDQTATQQTLR